MTDSNASSTSALPNVTSRVLDHHHGLAPDKSSIRHLVAAVVITALVAIAAGFVAAANNYVVVEPVRLYASFLSDVGSILALTTGATALWIAATQYRHTASADRGAHMHGLFRDFLHVRMDMLDRKEGAPGQGWFEEALGFRLYTLEEMLDWVRNEEAASRLQFADRKERDDYLNGWRRTIASHIQDCDRPSLVSHLNLFADCYGAEFLLFLSHVSRREDVRTIIDDELKKRPTRELHERRTQLQTRNTEEND